MKTRTVIIMLIVGMVALAGIFLVRRVISGAPETSQSTKQTRPLVVKTASAVRVDISRSLELTGSVEPYRVVQLASPAEGPALNIRVREGDRVRAGETLLSIGRKKGVDALITSLREELKKEEDNLRRTRQLVEDGAVPGEQLDQAKTAYEKVRAELVRAEETAQDYLIIAPWDGVVSRLLVKEGEFVAPRATLLEMYDPFSLVIRAAVPEKHAPEVTSGMRVDMRLDAYPDEIIRGRIERVYPYLDSRLRTRTVEIVPDNPVHLLPGMFARLKVLLKTAHDTIVVPLEAVVSTAEGQAVFVVENGKTFGRPVKTGIEESNRIQIIEGIHVGDVVIVAGIDKLEDGMAVDVPRDESLDKTSSQNMAVHPPKQGIKVEGGQK